MARERDSSPGFGKADIGHPRKNRTVGSAVSRPSAVRIHTSQDRRSRLQIANENILRLISVGRGQIIGTAGESNIAAVSADGRIDGLTV